VREPGQLQSREGNSVQESGAEITHQSQAGSTALKRSEWFILISIIALFLVQTLLILKQGAPLGHDEAVYALRSRDLTSGIDPAPFYWAAYRAPGLPIALSPLYFVRATEPYLRSVVSAFGVLLVVTTWWTGRSMFGRRAALIAAAGIAISPVVIGTSTQVWPDVPGAALGMLVLSFYAWTLSTGTVTRYAVVVIPVVTGLATLTRFGAPLPIAVGLIVLSLWRWRVAVKHWKVLSVTAVVTTAVVVAILMVPGVAAWLQGSEPKAAIAPLSAIRLLQQKSDFPWTKGFVDYWNLRMTVIGGAVVGLAIATGLLAGLLGTVKRRISVGAFAATVILVILTAGLIGITLHGEPRYLAPAYPWLWIAAGSGLGFLASSWDRTTGFAIGAFILMVVVVTGVPSSRAQSEFNLAKFQEIKMTGTRIEKLSDDFACSVLTSYAPQIGWYSKCAILTFDLASVRVTHQTLPSGDRYMVLVLHGKRQPQGDLLASYLLETSGLLFTVGAPELGPRQYVEVYDLNPELGGTG
jgi:4-amino-4-deoxy-L-arabinose transferase-like glycosyltransferase